MEPIILDNVSILGKVVGVYRNTLIPSIGNGCFLRLKEIVFLTGYSFVLFRLHEVHFQTVSSVVIFI